MSGIILNNSVYRSLSIEYVAASDHHHCLTSSDSTRLFTGSIMQVSAVSKGRGRPRCRGGTEGIDFVRCRICGKHLRVVSGRHLSTHGTDRETYVEEYRLSPDQLCSKTFRVNHSSRPDYCAHSRREWIAAIRTVYKQHGNIYAGFLQKHYQNLYDEGLWLNGSDWDAALRVLGFTPERMRLRTY